jgi:dinuclear metal center YbgI/SA1388 family protein
MVKALDIIGTCDRVLQPETFADYGPNGLQVPGRDEVRLVVTGVSATLALIEKAADLGADLVLTHHGLFWDGQPRALSSAMARRLRVLLGADIGLAAYHLPLDGHPEHGNNAILAERFGCELHENFMQIGRAGTFAGDGIPVEVLHARVREVTGREPLLQGAGPANVKRIAIVSGAAADMLADAAEQGFDAFVTGEPKERSMADAEEAGIHFFAAGHYATETFGIRRLGELIAAEHGIEHVFVDLPNPV